MMMSTEGEQKSKPGSLFGTLGVLALIFLKYKVFLITFVLSFGLYAMRYGWPYAVALIVLLYIHEMGHFIYMKCAGLNPQAPVFIPFLGAYVAMTNLPRDRAIHAWSAFAGPFLGGVTAIACFYYGTSVNEPYLVAAAYFGVFLNLLQLVPVKPFDGGFIAECVARWLLIPGSILFTLFGFFTNSWLFVLFGIIGFFQSIKGADETGMAEAGIWQKTFISAAYLTLLFSLAYVWLSADSALGRIDGVIR